MKVWLAGFALVAASSFAHAQLVVPISQNRVVSGDAGVNDFYGGTSQTDSDSDSAPDFGPFNEAASASLSPGNALGSGGGIQNSEILATSVVASGSSFANAESYDFDWEADAGGLSDLELVFTLTRKSSFTITGDIAAFDNGSASVYITTIQGTILAGEFAAGPSEMIAVNLSGTLDPGDYRFRARASGSCYASGFYFDYASSEYDVAFELTPLSDNYCVAAANSVGAGAVMSFSGAQDIGANNFFVQADGALPNGSGLFFYGPNRIQTPFGDGFRCVGGTTFRLQPPVQADGNGFVSKFVDFTLAPAGAGAGVRSR